LAATSSSRTASTRSASSRTSTSSRSRPAPAPASVRPADDALAAGALRHQDSGAGHAAPRDNLARIVSRADLTLNGTYDNAGHLRRADIDRGEIFFEGNRYRITRGTIDFLNPSRIQPFFDLEAETRIRVLADSQQRDRERSGDLSRHRPPVGTLDGRMNFEVNSDPPLATVDIISA
jgi:hypothetical protein